MCVKLVADNYEYADFNCRVEFTLWTDPLPTTEVQSHLVELGLISDVAMHYLHRAHTVKDIFFDI